jgi:hypothetical protein
VGWGVVQLLPAGVACAPVLGGISEVRPTMEQWLAIETRACAAWSKAFQWLAGASVVVLQQQTLKLSGHSNTVVAAVEAPLSTMRIVFKIASFAHFSTSPLLLHIKIRYGHQRRTYYTSSFTKPKNNTLLILIN